MFLVFLLTLVWVLCLGSVDLCSYLHKCSATQQWQTQEASERSQGTHTGVREEWVFPYPAAFLGLSQSQQPWVFYN